MSGSLDGRTSFGYKEVMHEAGRTAAVREPVAAGLPRTLLIYHEGSRADEEVLSRWLASFSHVAGIVVLKEPKRRRWERVKREIRRSGRLRFLDVAAFRIYYRLRLAGRDRAREARLVRELSTRYPNLGETATLTTESPNSSEAEAFIRGARPDIIIARCRTLLQERIFSLASQGTFVMHPGITPEYRNSHGCFWALANRDLERVGMTLLRIDAGVDTGPVFGYYSYDFDERAESHAVIQKRVVLENLDALRDKLLEIHRGEAVPLDTTGRHSAVWGQPWLTKYVRWKLAARRTG
jgi:folate-dependent phosphoribosylglycinamide formyltransferase PurN